MLPLREPALLDRRGKHDAGVVEDEVDAPELLADLVGGPVDRRLVGHVDRDRQRLAADVGDACGRASNRSRRRASTATWAPLVASSSAVAAPMPLLADFDARPPRERNHARWTFLDEHARDLYVDWETVARENELTTSFEAVRLTDDRGQTLFIYTPEPGSPSETALRLLASRAAGAADAPRHAEREDTVRDRR